MLKLFIFIIFFVFGSISARASGTCEGVFVEDLSTSGTLIKNVSDLSYDQYRGLQELAMAEANSHILAGVSLKSVTTESIKPVLLEIENHGISANVYLEIRRVIRENFSKDEGRYRRVLLGMQKLQEYLESPRLFKLDSPESKNLTDFQRKKLADLAYLEALINNEIKFEYKKPGT